MNYNTCMSADRLLPCSPAEFNEIKTLLDAQNSVGDEPTGLECEYDETEGIYFYGGESAVVENLSKPVLKLIGKLLKQAKIKYLELGLAFTSDRMVPQSQGGTYARILQTGELVSPKLVWPKRAQ